MEGLSPPSRHPGRGTEPGRALYRPEPRPPPGDGPPEKGSRGTGFAPKRENEDLQQPARHGIGQVGRDQRERG